MAIPFRAKLFLTWVKDNLEKFLFPGLPACLGGIWKTQYPLHVKLTSSLFVTAVAIYVFIRWLEYRHLIPPFDYKRVFSMPLEHRLRLLEKWKELFGKVESSLPETNIPCGRKRQAELEELRHIDFDPINTLLSSLGIGVRLATPMTSYRRFKSLQGEMFDRVKSEVFKKLEEARTSGKFADLADRVDRAYDYLAEEDVLPAGRTIDIAFVPGYRQLLRAQRAGELLSNNNVSRVFLSGNLPRYDVERKNVLSEAAAMAIYLRDVFSPKILPDRLIVDERPTNTRENIVMSQGVMEALRARRPLSIAIVTSPYHMRRAYLMCLAFKSNHPHLIGEVFRVTAESAYLRDNWFKTQKGVGHYLSEYWKLHGGRVVGQF